MGKSLIKSKEQKKAEEAASHLKGTETVKARDAILKRKAELKRMLAELEDV